MTTLLKWLSFLFFLTKYKLGMVKHQLRGKLLVDKLKKMGVLFVKVGQILSIQYNCMDSETRDELRKLQSQNDGTDYRKFEIKDVVVQAQPFACGSIAHVYKGTYKGKIVAVKVLRANVLEDLAATRKVLGSVSWLMKVCPKRIKRLGLQKLGQVLLHIMETQLNFRNELDNWRHMVANYRGTDIYIPHMYEELCSETVLVMDYVDGYTVYDMHTLPIEVVSEKAKELVRVFFRGLFKEGMIHGDCHAGNIFWTKDTLKLGFYDFGIVQKIDKETSRTFIKLYGSLFMGDLDAAANVIIHSFIEAGEDSNNILALQRMFHTRLSKGVENVNVIKDFHQLYSSSDIMLRHDFTITNITLLNIDGILEAMAHRFDIIKIVKELMKEMIMNGEIDL